MHRFAAVLTCCATFAGPLHAQDKPEARVFRRATAHDHETRIYTYTQHRSDCTAYGTVSINVTTAPLHGTVTTRPGSVVVGDPPRFGGTDCRGKRLEGLGVWYTPAAGYTGTDQFDWYVIFTNGTGHDSAVVTVN